MNAPVKSVSVLGLIPARGGSKGLPGKNIRLLNGKPLIAHTIQAALESGVCDRVVVSTDDPEIAEVAKKYGAEVPFMRPAHLATDEAGSVEVALHALEQIPASHLILLQPTSPLRTAKDIVSAWDQCKKAGAPSCISVCEVDKSPYWMYKLGEGGKLLPLLPPPGDIKNASTKRRQDLPKVYVPNGAIYVTDVEVFKKSQSFVTPETLSWIMPRERSIDIDTEVDFTIAERSRSH